MTAARRAGLAMLAALAVVAIAGPFAFSHDPSRQFPDMNYAPPMLPHVVTDDGRWRAPFVYPVRLENRLTRTYVEDRGQPRTIRWFANGALAGIDERSGPWLPLGGDALGRDVLVRVIAGMRFSLGVAAAAGIGALLLGAIIGAWAGFAGGLVDDLLMRVADFVLVLPAIYVVLALRAAMPLVLSTAQVFWTVTVVLALAGWPYVARGVRAIVAAEKRQEYAEAARAIGAGPLRILLHHLVPAASGYLVVQATLLLPAFILAEATLSFVGLGFAEPSPSWGRMLQDAADVSALSAAPWLLAPAAAIAFSVLALHLAASSPVRRSGTVRVYSTK